MVKAADERAGLGSDLSAYWLPHAHASHSLDRVAPIHLVQQALGPASVATTGRYLHAPAPPTAPPDISAFEPADAVLSRWPCLPQNRQITGNQRHLWVFIRMLNRRLRR